ncbi:MAG: hypothetical protein HUJ51_05420 [Eggerthellaceae bacterium]|nr:hypothetical protein [Eggerthellaceae bacterium]
MLYGNVEEIVIETPKITQCFHRTKFMVGYFGELVSSKTTEDYKVVCMHAKVELEAFANFIMLYSSKGFKVLSP